MQLVWGKAMVEDLMAYNMPVEGISLQRSVREEVLANLTVAMEHKTIQFPSYPYNAETAESISTYKNVKWKL